MYEENIYNDPCTKIDPWCVDAYFELSLDDIDPAQLTLNSSWEPTTVDLTPAVKTAETITNLILTDKALQFNREDYGRDGAENGGIDCINGDALSRIISMQYLRDVTQETPPTTGDVYMYDAFLNLFQPFNLQTFVDSTNAAIQDLQERVQTWEEALNLLGVKVNNNYIAQTNALQNYMDVTNKRLDIIEATIARPAGIPTDTRIAYANINYYSDHTNTDNRNHGIFTHSTALTIADDTKDA